MNFPKFKILPSYLVLIFSNLLTIVFAIIQNWSVGEVLWMYLFQSIIIGVFNFAKMMSLKTFRTDGFTANGHKIEPSSEKSRNSTAIFFLMHYGLFHFVYIMFLFVDYKDAFLSLTQDLFFLIAAAAFLINHFFSFLSNYKKDINRNLNIGTLFMFPYARILPMHLMIVLAIFLGGKTLIFFMILKTLADLVMHAIEHSLNSPQPQPQQEPQQANGIK